jgi:nucleotide-binding universal stress UspA family protein
MMDYAEQKREKIADDILESGKARCIVLGDRVKTIAMTGDPAQIIIDYAERSDVDLVIMGSCGCSGFRCRLLGRVTNKVVQGIDKAVLITR